jgi:Ni,Fe-hydrogenase I large subunit
MTPKLLFPNGRLVGGNLERSVPAEPSAVGEAVEHAWYRYSDGDDAQLRRPVDGETEPDYDAAVPLVELDGPGKYTWVKAARAEGLAMESGPLARILVGAANGAPEVSDALGRLLTRTGLSRSDMLGALGRAFARAVELDVLTSALQSWLNGLKVSLASGDLAVASMELWDPVSWPSEVEGVSFGEGPRGSVGHWLRIKDAVIDRYQVVDGSTWNLAPRDNIGRSGPVESALAGIQVADAAQPVELLRVIHSFAPCSACAAHAVTAAGGPAAGHRPEGTR